ncbi:hypothetical protein KI387_018025, partial [Taxus chinensis]
REEKEPPASTTRGAATSVSSEEPHSMLTFKVMEMNKINVVLQMPDSQSTVIEKPRMLMHMGNCETNAPFGGNNRSTRTTLAQANGMNEQHIQHIQECHKRIFEMVGPFVDSLKFDGGSYSSMPKTFVKEITGIAHMHNVNVGTGDWADHLLQKGPSAFRQYLK